jgi:hypothetical protein
MYNILGNKNTETIVSDDTKINFLVFSFCEVIEEGDLREVNITIAERFTN